MPGSSERHREQIRELLSNYGKVDMMCLDMPLPDFCWPDIKETVLMARAAPAGRALPRPRHRGLRRLHTPENWVPTAEGLDDNRVTARGW